MNAPDFGEFYQAINGYRPFPWQQRLAERVLSRGWPDAIDVPTGCGKTSVLDVAVYALAMQAGQLPASRTPLRIFFVVDRRLVVDDVSDHAFHLQEKVENDPALEWAREQFKKFDCARPLDVAVMRGGMYRNDTWADAPNQPLICVSTVDQVGSRLLFRGYGVSENGRPVHAGLVGNDSLLIVDEAHLSQPFLETLRAVRGYQDQRDVVTVPGVRFVQMSATGGGKDGAEILRLEGSDYQDDNLRRRLEAPKVAELQETGSLPAAAAEAAARLARPDTGVVGVVLNTVAAARATFEILRAKFPEECILLTGRIRPYDRDDLLSKFGEQMMAKRVPRDGKRLFVVATQTIEVGADLDFDALVTEAAPLDSLRQRFGRLNRLGEGPEARAVILKPKKSKESEGIYGAALEKTWEWVKQYGGDRIDFGVKSMGELFDREGDPGLLTRKGKAPVMLPAHVDAWAQTNPAPAAEPNVAHFLHGTENKDSADVQIVWRADLEDTEEAWIWKERVAAAPPVSSEALPLPIYAAKRWLEHKAAALVADVEGTGSDESDATEKVRPFLIWRGPDETRPGLTLRPGDTVIVRSSEGGCDGYGWYPQSKEPVRDIGDLCANERVTQVGGRYRVRVVPELLFPQDDEMRTRAREYLKHWDQGDEQEDEAIEEAILQNAQYHGKPRRRRAYGENWLLIQSQWTKPEKKLRRGEAPDETDQDDSSSATTCITLREHSDGVMEKARTFAAACGVNGSAAASIESAARLHDQGKQDERFQFMLSPEETDEPLAKNEVGLTEWRRRQQAVGFPKGARHEFASVALAEKLCVWAEGTDPELALHLIGTHHGYGRAFPRVWNDAGQTIKARIDGREVSVGDVHRVARVDSGWVDRFWLLNRKYGWWGLAYLEAILRRADCVRSREEQEK